MQLADFRAITEQERWASQVATMLQQPEFPAATVHAFGTHWIEAGHHLRSQIADDKLLVQLLRHLLPAYEGQTIELFRGENRERWERKAIGLAWSSNLETARMFGRGLNAVWSGGVLLKAQFSREAIVAGPNAHSSYLGEGQFTIDPFWPAHIEAVEFYPPVS